MKNKEGIFSFQELSKLKDFCNNCAKEDKKIHEKRKNNPSYVPEEKSQNQLNKKKYLQIKYQIKVLKII